MIVKSIVKGSTVDQDGRIHIGDIILSVSSTKNTTDGYFIVHSDNKYLVVSNIFSAESESESAQLATFSSFILPIRVFFS